MKDPDSIENKTNACSIKVTFAGQGLRGPNGPGEYSGGSGDNAGPGLGFTVSGSVNNGQIGFVDEPNSRGGADHMPVNPNGSWTIQQYGSFSDRSIYQFLSVSSGVIPTSVSTQPDGPSASKREISASTFKYYDFPGPVRNTKKGTLSFYEGEYDFAAKLINSNNESCEVKFHISMSLRGGTWTVHWRGR